MDFLLVWPMARNQQIKSISPELTAKIDEYDLLENPAPEQTKALQQNLADINLYPSDRINGQSDSLFEFSRAIASDANLAQSALIGYLDLPAGTANPDQVLAAKISLNKLGYPTALDVSNSPDFNSKLRQYHEDNPLPLTNQQLDLIASEVASVAPLDAHDGKIEVRQNSIPDLVQNQLVQMEKYKTLPHALSAAEKLQLDGIIGEKLAQISEPIPQISPKKLLDVQSQSQQSPVILRVTPDQISANSFISQRMEMRAIWEAGNQAIEAAGGRIEAIDGSLADGGKREIFTRDRFIMVGNKAYLPDVDFYRSTDPDYAGYKSEIEQARNFLKKQGIETIDVPNTWFEGGNIIQHNKSNTIFMGLAPEDDPQNAQRLIVKINETQPEKRTMIAVPMVEYDRMGVYHLDLAMSEPLANGKLMFDQNITDLHTRQRIEDIVGKENIIPITRDEAVQGSANILRVGQTAIMTNISDRLKGVLDKEGLSYISASDFEKTGNQQIDQTLARDGLGIGNGGMHCMGQEIAEMPSASTQIKSSFSPQISP